MWFKKGELDEAAAKDAAANPQDPAAATKADEIPIEDRYKDDGSITDRDRERLSLRTGATQMMPVIKAAAPTGGDKMGEDELAKELSAGRGKMIALVVVALLLIAAVVLYFTVFRKSSDKPAAPAAPAAGATHS
jgi:hypothetical protein